VPNWHEPLSRPSKRREDLHFIAFADHELAGAIVALCGTAPGVFLLPETRFTPELVHSLTTHPVVVFRTYDDYDSAMSHVPAFQWAEHMVNYDFVAALEAVRPIGQEHAES
jgi:hypothetical protein